LIVRPFVAAAVGLTTKLSGGRSTMAAKVETLSTERVLVAVNVEAGNVVLEVGFNPNENASFTAERIDPYGNITGPLRIAEVGDHKITFDAHTRHFWFYVRVFAQTGTPFTIRLRTTAGSNGWFELRGYRYSAGNGGSVSQTFNATLEGFEVSGEAVRS
jgi:hypothetical protein